MHWKSPGEYNPVSSTTRLFADDCLLYRRIRTTEDQAILQRDLDNLQQWENNWLMRFNGYPIMEVVSDPIVL
jgi:hypothetical protein